MVHRWRSWFLEGRQNVHDDERSGRPVTATDNAAVAAVRNVVEANRRVTIDEIIIRLPPRIKIGRSSIGTIMSDVLNFRKAARAFLEIHRRDGDQLFSRIVTGDESWMHHSTPETKRQSMVWKKPEESAPKKAKVTISAVKVMAIVFWYCKGVLLVDYLPPNTTVNAGRYCEVLTKLRAAIKRKRPGLLSRKVLLVHDNARPHAARTTQTLLENFKLEIFTHPPYSPDLSPSDFNFFSALKLHLGGKHFANDDEVQAEANHWLRRQGTAWYNSDINATKCKLDYANNDLMKMSDVFLQQLEDDDLNDELQYLKGQLRGEALRLVNAFPITADNYVEVWQTLLTRYDNPKDLIFTLIDNALRLPKLADDNHNSMFKLLDSCNEIVRTVKVLGYQIDSLSEVFFVKIIPDKLDKTTRKQWELQNNPRVVPSIKDLMEFLEIHAKALQNLPNEDSNVEKHSMKKNYKRCLKPNHLANNCYCKNNCQICKKRHHTLIHQETKVQEVDEEKFECGKDIKNITCLLSNEKYFSNVMLTTARIKTKDNNGVPQTCRALIDSGSQANFISGQCRKRLGLEYVTLHLQISGISGHFASHSYGLVEFEFTPYFKSD
ncbi:hypothetical protein LAZ67_3002629 [Cordylochernes scorpioides]|uniref:Transposase n=1 Tax=Cordylochernes scorpioides TaxID=51811 RepID=A0ABY6K7X8_9ARAC|nr:hypothetical protein LAZ67_3002629 [Cordylochernes scorpioides]